MWKKKQGAFSLLAGLTILTAGCKETDPSTQFRLIQTVSLPSYPSASAIEYHEGRLFIFGDDAPYGLVMDTNFRVSDTLLLGYPVHKKIPGSVKPDLESAAILTGPDGFTLYAFGSGSTSERKRLFRFSSDSFRSPVINNLPQAAFAASGPANIEGACFVKGRLLLANRANLKNPLNELIIFPMSSIGSGTGKVKKAALKLPAGEEIAGVSGLYYLEEKDLLFFTASTEATSDPTLDGMIGDSYLGWIEKYSLQKEASLAPDGWINLSRTNKRFRGQKLESVCVISGKGRELKLFLVADNDDGASTLFKATLRL